MKTVLKEKNPWRVRQNKDRPKPPGNCLTDYDLLPCRACGDTLQYKEVTGSFWYGKQKFTEWRCRTCWPVEANSSHIWRNTAKSYVMDGDGRWHYLETAVARAVKAMRKINEE